MSGRWRSSAEAGQLQTVVARTEIARKQNSAKALWPLAHRPCGCRPRCGVRGWASPVPTTGPHSAPPGHGFTARHRPDRMKRIDLPYDNGSPEPVRMDAWPACASRTSPKWQHQGQGLTGLRAQWAGERPAPSQRSYAALTPPSDPAAKQSPQAAARRQPLIQRMSSERWRMASSLLLSLLLHGSLLSLTFGGQGLGLPGLKFPWQERRIEVPELRVVLVPAPLTPAEPAVKSVAGPAQQASIAPPVAGGRARTPPASPAPPLGRATLEIVPLAKPKAETKPERNAVAPAPPAKAPIRAGESGHAVAAKIPKPAAIDVAPSAKSKWVVPVAPTAPASVIAAPPGASSPETVMPVHRDAGDPARAANRPGRSGASR